MTFAIFNLSGNIPVIRDWLIIKVTDGTIISIKVTLNDLGKSSCLRFLLISSLMASHVLRVFVLN